jgi:hypothetical protein
MMDGNDKQQLRSAAASGDSRRDRLKLALRENLKRRRSQARGRSELADASSADAEAALDDAGEAESHR